MKSQKKINNEKQWLFFYFVLCNKGRESELSGKTLYGELNSCWFHHILPKSKYPLLRYCIDNIIMLTADEHNSVENGTEYELITKRKTDLLYRYEELVEETKEYVDNYLNPSYEHTIKNTNFFNKK